MRQLCSLSVVRSAVVVTWALAAASLTAVESPITSGYGADGPYVGAFTTFTCDNPASVGVTLKPVRAYVANAAPAGPRPLLIIAHAYGGEFYQSAGNGYLPGGYPDLTRFALGKGWTVVFIPYPTTGVTDHQRYDVLWSGVTAAVADASAGPRIDTSYVGVFGHSFGGGAAPWLAWKATVEQGWGSNGAFVMSCAPWYRFGLTPERWAQLPATLDALVQVYDQDDTNDHAMAIDLYHQYPQTAAHRDYVLVSGGSGPAADHVTPSSSGTGSSVLNDLDWYGVERLIDGLADHAWHGVDAGRDTALGHGSVAQTTMPAPMSLESRWSSPTAQQPASLTFAWADRDTWQPPPTVAFSGVPATATAGDSVALAATAAGIDGAYIEHVSYFADGAAIGVATTAPYSLPWTAARTTPGTATVTLTATAMDDDGRETTATTSITVAPANSAPVAADQSVSTPAGTALPITLSASDADSDALTFAIVAAPAHGVLSGSGANRTYTPTAGFTGSDSFTFTANDGTATSVAATVSIAVTATPTTDPGTGDSGGGGGGCGVGSVALFALLGLAVAGIRSRSRG
jgi:hypothetical protein